MTEGGGGGREVKFHPYERQGLKSCRDSEVGRGALHVSTCLNCCHEKFYTVLSGEAQVSDPRFSHFVAPPPPSPS